jgi:hypothetical protein
MALFTPTLSLPALFACRLAFHNSFTILSRFLHVFHSKIPSQNIAGEKVFTIVSVAVAAEDSLTICEREKYENDFELSIFYAIKIRARKSKKHGEK